MGAINSLLQNDFQNQVKYLIILEALYFGIIMTLFLSGKVYHSKTKAFIMLTLSIVKIVLMISLYTDKESLSDSFLAIEEMHSIIVVISLNIWGLSIAF